MWLSRTRGRPAALALLAILIIAAGVLTARRAFRRPLAPAQRIEHATQVVGCYELAVGPCAPATIHSLTYWEVDSLTGGVRLTFSTGLSGVQLDLASHGDSLIGTAREFWDFSAPQVTARARAVRAPCAREGGLELPGRAAREPAA